MLNCLVPVYEHELLTQPSISERKTPFCDSIELVIESFKTVRGKNFKGQVRNVISGLYQIHGGQF